MAIKTVIWTTPGWLDCANPIFCGSANSMNVILRLIDDKAAEAPSGCPVNTIYATLTKVQTIPGPCDGGVASYKYTFAYDDAQTGGTTLVATDIIGAACDGALANLIADRSNYFRSSGYVVDGGETEYDGGELSVDATGDIAIAYSPLLVEVENDPLVFGCKDLIAKAVISTTFGYRIQANSELLLLRRATINGVVGSWVTIFDIANVGPATTGIYRARQHFDTTEYINEVLSGDNLSLSVEFKFNVPTLQGAGGVVIYDHSTWLTLNYWVK